MTQYAAKTFQKEPLTKSDLTRMDLGISTAHSELIQAIACEQAEVALTGGGTVTYDSAFNLKWTQRFTMNPVDKSLSTTGTVDVTMPANGTVIAGLGTTPSVTVTASGILLPAWTALFAVVTPGSAGAYTLKVGKYDQMASGVLDSNHMMLAVRNGDDNTLKLGTGAILKPGEVMNNGRPTTTVDNQTINQAAPAAGQTQPYWTFQQGGVTDMRFGLDSSGNLVLERWTGAAWANVATFLKAGGTATNLDADKVDGIHLRENSILEYSLDGATWKQAGVPRSEVAVWAFLL